MIDMDQVEDFYEALSAAIESGLDTPGAHAVSDMYRAALARAEAAEARADEMEVDRDNWKARADAAEYEVMARPGIDKRFQALNEGLIAARAQLAALKAAGEWRPVTETDPPNGPWVQVGWPDGNISKAHRYDEDTWINTDGLKFQFVPGKNPMFRYLPTPPKGNQ